MRAGPTGGVWVIVDHAGDEVEDIALDLLGQARELADRLGLSAVAVLLGDDIRGLAPLVGQCGADTVYLAESPTLSTSNPDAYPPLLADLIRGQQPSIVLWGATDQGRDLAPRVAARLGTGLASNCTRVDLSDDGLLEEYRRRDCRCSGEGFRLDRPYRRRTGRRGAPGHEHHRPGAPPPLTGPADRPARGPARGAPGRYSLPRRRPCRR